MSLPYYYKVGKLKNEHVWLRVTTQHAAMLIDQNRNAWRKQIAADKKTQTAMEETRKGREATSWREAAHAHREEGDLETAFAYYEKAASIFSHDDLSATAAAAFHDLGEALLWHQEPGRAPLFRALTLFERALESPARREDLRRRLMTMAGKSKCLRKLAESTFADAERAEFLKLAVDAADAGIALAESASRGSGPLDAVLGGLALAAGNALMQSERYGEAIKRLRLSRAAFLRTVAIGLSSVEDLQTAGLVLLAALRRRGKKQDLKDARKIWDSPEFNEVGGRLRNGVLMEQALFVLAAEPNEKKRHKILVSLKDLILPSTLTPDFGDQLIELATASKNMALIRPLFQLWQDVTLAERANAISPETADYIAEPLQAASWQLAALGMHGANSVAGFLDIENVSSRRWLDGLLQRARGFVTDVDASILSDLNEAEYHLRIQRDAYICLTHMEPIPAISLLLAGMNDELAGLPLPVRQRVSDLWHICAKKPAEALELIRQELTFQQVVAQNAANRLTTSPQMKKSSVFSQPFGTERLTELLRAHPDTVFARVGMRGNILRVIAVWWDGERIASAHHAHAIPNSFIDALMTATGKDVWKAGAIDAWAELDLWPTLGGKRMHRLAILSDSLGARLPLDALGKPGTAAIDRFDSVVWLPSLAGIEMPWVTDTRRQGTIALTPDGTKFADVAFLGRDDIHRIPAGHATLEAYRDAAARAQVLGVYTHGQHATYGDPKTGLGLDDGYIWPPGLGVDVGGLERVELWACESGVDTTSAWFGPTADEPYGMDGRFLLAGVRSTIGTLWPVNEIVTACIARKFRELLDGGAGPDVALVGAKRWWRNTGVAWVTDHLWVDKSGQPDLSVSRVIAILDLQRALGPAPSRDDAAHLKIEEFRRIAGHPGGWAGYRFQGDWRASERKT